MLTFKIEESFNEFSGLAEFDLFKKQKIGYEYVGTFPSRSETYLIAKKLIEKEIADATDSW